jgi:hypothetical protein
MEQKNCEIGEGKKDKGENWDNQSAQSMELGRKRTSAVDNQRQLLFRCGHVSREQDDAQLCVELEMELHAPCRATAMFSWACVRLG